MDHPNVLKHEAWGSLKELKRIEEGEVATPNEYQQLDPLNRLPKYLRMHDLDKEQRKFAMKWTERKMNKLGVKHV
jgi:hypothetical protein